jgi:hypothetical protein
MWYYHRMSAFGFDYATIGALWRSEVEPALRAAGIID